MNYYSLKISGLLMAALLLFSAGSTVMAQGKVSDSDPNVREYPVMSVKRVAQVDPKAMTEDWYPFVANYQVIHQPGVDAKKDEFLAKKARITAEWEAKRDQLSGAAPSNKVTANPPTLGSNFYANPYDGGIPNDNSIAVSNAGHIVSSTNSTVRAYSSFGTTLLQKSMQSFSNNLGGQAIKYDPKTEYHSAYDRFIVVFLVGDESAFSRILIGFSTTREPSDPWNIYTLEGNATGVDGGADVWTDFPQTAITNTDLIITGNLFTDAGFGTGSVVWQVQLAEGFNGGNLVTKKYTTSYFSLHPVGGGSELIDYPAYLVRNVSNPFSTTKSVFVHELTNSVANNGTLSSPGSLNSSLAYGLAPDATQKGTSLKLQTNDCRIQSSYIRGNRIEYAHNTADGQGRPAIYHGTIELSPSGVAFSQATGRYISVDSFEIGYPGIAYGGCEGANGENSSLIAFCFASPDHYPGNGAIFVDETGSISEPLVCKYGFTYMGSGTDPWRWGDYADADERRNNNGEIWVGASFGLNGAQHQNATWVSQVFTPCSAGPTAVEDAMNENAGEMKVFPIPAVEMVNFEFDVPETEHYEVKIINLNGQVVKELVRRRLKKGKATTEFNTLPLPNGLYFVVVEGNAGPIYKEKFVVKH